MKRSIENQTYSLSLNRAGEHFGDSLFCLPWMDDNKPPLSFDASKEQLQYVEVKREIIDQERQNYTFLADRLPSYDIPVKLA